jgi:hypothetical protein
VRHWDVFCVGNHAISVSSLNSYGLYIEHMGLLSVSVEVMLLALVLSYQFAQLYRDKNMRWSAWNTATALPVPIL